MLIGLDADGLVRRARASARLDDFGAGEFRHALGVLCASLEAEARLTWKGRMVARQDVLRLLRNRLNLTADRERFPAIADEQIVRPVFVVGLPRTGTTILHNLLALDPANRAPMSWEVMSPSPPPEGAARTTDRRVRRAARQLRWLDRLAPEFKAIHPLGATLPQECIAITAHSFLSDQFPIMHFVPAYQSWLARQDLGPAYEFHKRFLQQLQWRHARDRWVLKAPAHLFSLEALFATYPDATVIQTHRDPLEVVASLASLVAALHGAFSKGVNPRAVGPELTARWAGAMNDAIAARARLEAQNKRFLDVPYKAFVADPIAMVRRIYAELEIPFTDEAEGRMRRFLADNPKDQHGRHKYSLEQFGLDRAEESRRFAPYCERFGLGAGS